MRRRRPRGFTMVALMVGITIMLIMIAAVLPTASTQAQREKEEELIFRGLQYAEGIRVFRKRYGRYPTSLKEMIDVKPRTIRKLWKDPITNSEEWGIISLAGAPLPGQPGSGLPGTGRRGSGTSSFGSSFGGGSSTFGGSGTFGSGSGSTAKPTPSSGGSGLPDFGGPASGGNRSGSPGQQGIPGPVMGVYSLSTKKSIRLYEGRDVYNEWRFTEQSQVGAGAGKAPDAGPGFGSNRPGVPTPVPRRR